MRMKGRVITLAITKKSQRSQAQPAVIDLHPSASEMSLRLQKMELACSKPKLYLEEHIVAEDS